MEDRHPRSAKLPLRAMTRTAISGMPTIRRTLSLLYRLLLYQTIISEIGIPKSGTTALQRLEILAFGCVLTCEVFSTCIQVSLSFPTVTVQLELDFPVLLSPERDEDPAWRFPCCMVFLFDSAVDAWMERVYGLVELVAKSTNIVYGQSLIMQSCNYLLMMACKNDVLLQNQRLCLDLYVAFLQQYSKKIILENIRDACTMFTDVIYFSRKCTQSSERKRARRSNILW